MWITRTLSSIVILFLYINTHHDTVYRVVEEEGERRIEAKFKCVVRAQHQVLLRIESQSTELIAVRICP